MMLMTRHTMNAMAIIAPVNGPLLLMNSANLSPSLACYVLPFSFSFRISRSAFAGVAGYGTVIGILG